MSLLPRINARENRPLFLPSEPAVGNFAFLCSVLYETIRATNALILLPEAISGGGGGERGGVGEQNRRKLLRTSSTSIVNVAAFVSVRFIFLSPISCAVFVNKKKAGVENRFLFLFFTLLTYLASFVCLSSHLGFVRRS